MIGHQRAGDLQLGFVQRARAPTKTATGDGCFPTGFAGEPLLFEFVLAKRRQHVNGEAPRRRGSVDVLPERNERDLLAGQLIADIEGMPDIATKAIKADDDDRITGAGELDQLGQFLPVVPATARGLLEDAFTSSLFEGVDLGLVILSGGAATAVANFHKCPKTYLCLVNCDGRI